MKRTLIYLAVLALIQQSRDRRGLTFKGVMDAARPHGLYTFGQEPDDSATLISYRFGYAA